MNKSKVLQWLVDEAAEKAAAHYSEVPPLDLALESLNQWRPVDMPKRIPKSRRSAIEFLRNFYRDRVTFISLVLSHRFPKDFFFYRVSRLEEEIFNGLAFFSDLVDEFRLPFDRVGTKGVERYLQLNETLIQFAERTWPKSKKNGTHKELLYFLYEGLAQLFLEREDYNRYWVLVSKEDYFESFDSDAGETVWSGRKEMKKGDVVFYYRMAPRKAITDVLRVKEDPSFDPWGGWWGFWVTLEKVGPINDIPFSQMKRDEILRDWSVVRRNFLGTVAEPIPHSVYNRLLQYIPPKTAKKYGLRPEPVAASRTSGTYRSEEDFENQAVVPLLKQWSLRYRRQYPCAFQFGTQLHVGRVDFYVTDNKGALTLFENKLRILNDRDLQRAADQAKSYALILGLPSFVVASPEGLWVYRLRKNLATLAQHVEWEELQTKQQEDRLRDTLLRLRRES